jgi:superfamily II DNA/RNA helicase
MHMVSSFNELGLSAPLLKALDEMGFVTPTEVQGRAIPQILEKKDLMVMSKTGSGKTAVFGVSMLEMIDPNQEGPQGLILTPTRELAVQVDSDLKQMAKYLPHKTTAVYGQHSMNAEITVLKKGVTIVTGTPGRVYDHIQHGNLVTKNIRFLVLDEADRMLDMGFIDQVEKIIRSLPKDRITLLFSATFPDEIKRLCTRYMKNPETIEIESATKTVDTIEQFYYRVNHNEKNTWLHRLLLVEQPESCMIFCNTRMAVDRVCTFLTRKGLACHALHGDIPQGRRIRSIQQFKQGDYHILVATDVAARGIHIEELSLVINYDVPNEKDSYVHRIGRTGRAGKAGRAITLVTSDDIMSLYEIEEHIGVLIREEELPTEEVINQRKAEAEPWIQANAVKHEPQQQKAQQKKKSSTGKNQSRNGDGKSSERNANKPGTNQSKGSKRQGQAKAGSSAANKPDKPQSGENRQEGARKPNSSRNNGGRPHNGRPKDGRSNENRPSGNGRPRNDRPVTSSRPPQSREGMPKPVSQPQPKPQSLPQEPAAAPKKESLITRLIHRVFGKK